MRFVLLCRDLVLCGRTRSSLLLLIGGRIDDLEGRLFALLDKGSLICGSCSPVGPLLLSRVVVGEKARDFFLFSRLKFMSVAYSGGELACRGDEDDGISWSCTFPVDIGHFLEISLRSVLSALLSLDFDRDLLLSFIRVILQLGLSDILRSDVGE